ncbi:MAG: DUF1634 domain-containing protein [Chloroflexi bacterium]|nr:DUF1634 domain-containing protein [Chloroflexota bacterium]
MQEPRQRWSDEQTGQYMGTLLRVGITLAALVVAFGGLVYLLRHGGQQPDYKAFHSVPREFRTFRGIFDETFSFSGRGLIQLGILLLVATPVARVAFSLFAFLLQRDWLYTVVTVIVLGLLLFSLVHGGV